MSIPYMHYAPSNAKKMASLNAQLKKNWLLNSVDNLICFLFFSLNSHYICTSYLQINIPHWVQADFLLFILSFHYFISTLVFFFFPFFINLYYKTRLSFGSVYQCIEPKLYPTKQLLLFSFSWMDCPTSLVTFGYPLSIYGCIFLYPY